MRWQNAYGIRGAAAGTLLLTVCLWTACACAQGTHLQVRRISPSGANVPSIAHKTTADHFRFLGVDCVRKYMHSSPGRSSTRAQPPCLPGSVKLRFDAPVPRATLAAIQWQPMPMSRANLAKWWRDYPDWALGGCQCTPCAARPYSAPLGFRLRPMHTYVVTVPAGVKDDFGRVLAKSVTVKFRTGHRRGMATLPAYIAVLGTGQPTDSRFSFVNLEKLTFRWRRLDATALATGGSPSTLQTVNLLKRSDLDVRADHLTRGALGLRNMLNGGSGVIMGDVHSRLAKFSHDDPVLAEVTPYEVVAKVGTLNSLVWVSRLDNGEPVAGAHVRLVRGTGDKFYPWTRVGRKFVTNRMGLAMLPGTAATTSPTFSWQGDDPDLAYFVVVTRGDAAAVLPLGPEFRHWAPELSPLASASWNAARDGYMRSWVVTEQGIYQPGTDVHLAVFARVQRKAGLQIPPALDYTLTIVGPKRNVMLRYKHVKLSAWGGWHGTAHVPASAAAGWYRVRLGWQTPGRMHVRTAGRFLVTGIKQASSRSQMPARSTWLAWDRCEQVKVAATARAGRGIAKVTASPDLGHAVTLVPGKATYHVGEMAHVRVRNPYPGARALVTVERYGVLWEKAMLFAGSAPVIDVPIQPGYAPGVLLSVAVFSPRTAPPADPDTGKPRLALGHVPLVVAGGGPSLRVVVAPTQRQVTSGQRVDVTVNVDTHAGKAADHAHLVVTVVDQTLLDLLKSGVGYYDPRKSFDAPPTIQNVLDYSLARRLLSTLPPNPRTNWSSPQPAAPMNSLYLPPPPPQLPATQSSGADAAARLSREVSGLAVRNLSRHAAYWNANLQTDASGHAHFSFNAPDIPARWSILVIAMGSDAAMGLGDSSVRVNLSRQRRVKVAR